MTSLNTLRNTKSRIMFHSGFVLFLRVILCVAVFFSTFMHDVFFVSQMYVFDSCWDIYVCTFLTCFRALFCSVSVKQFCVVECSLDMYDICYYVRPSCWHLCICVYVCMCDICIYVLRFSKSWEFPLKLSFPSLGFVLIYSHLFYLQTE